jgi:hypothetical protein
MVTFMTLARLVSFFAHDRIKRPARRGRRFLWRCAHNRITWPQAPRGQWKDATPMVRCLDCGMEMSYDWAKMKQGKER